MDIYSYIAFSDPYAAKSICNKFGYDCSAIETTDQLPELADLLKQVVADQGESALRAVADVHPDKDLILEIYGKPGGKGCGCSEDKNTFSKVVDSYVQNANHATQGFSFQQGNTFIIAAALILAVAIVSSNK